MRHRHFAVFTLVTLSAAFVDQALKALMIDLLVGGSQISLTSFAGFRLAYNTGISFGIFAEMFQHSPWVLVGLKLAITFVITLLAWRARRPGELIGYGLIAGGAIGNILDRIRVGAVIDYIDLFLGTWHFPVFNAADCLLSTGVGILIWTTFRRNRAQPATP